MLGKTVGAGGKNPAESDEAHGALIACCGFGEAIGGGGEERGEKRAVEMGGELLVPWVFGLERPGGGPVLGSMLGAVARRAAKRGVCAQRGERSQE